MENTKDFLSSVLCEIANAAAMGAAYPNWEDNFARKQVKEVWTDSSTPLRKTRNRKVIIAELCNLPIADLQQLGFGKWSENLIVIPLWAYNYIADGEILTCIDGRTIIKGQVEIDLDVRYGCIAYGFVPSST